MDKYTKLTLEEMIRRKEQMLEAKKTPKKADFYVESLDGIITIKEPSKSILDDTFAMDGKEADNYLVYQVVEEPNLKKLATEYGCDIRTDIVDIVFKYGEVKKIATFALELAGYTDNAVVPAQDLKN